jgi:DNA repair exonuclease SbcCD nuclease subunit
MKILFFTDLHYRGNNPCSRIDDYPKTLQNKLQEIGQLIRNNKIAAVLNGGDLFHSPCPSLSLVNEIMGIFKSWNASIFSVLGSHEIIGYNYDTLYRTALGVLETSGVTCILNKEKGTIVGESLGRNVVVKGAHHSYNLDSNPKNYFVKKDNPSDVLIEVAHGMVVDKLFFDEYTLIKDIKTEADIFLSAHFHPGWEPQKINNTLFINPGSLGRVENIERKWLPSVVILDIEKDIDYEIVPLKCAEPSEKVFKNATKLGSEMSGRILEFMKTLSERTGNLERQDVKSLVLKIAKEESVDEEIVKEAINIIDEAMVNE